MNDITWCVSKDCPSKDCKIHISKCKARPDELISMADFSGTCRYYIAWVLEKVENGDK